MPLRFFTIPIRQTEIAETELNAFLSNHRVLCIDRRWVDVGCDSFWSVCIDYLDHGSKPSTPSNRNQQRTRIDYREILSEEEFALFATLRDLRKEIAQQEAVPVYTVFTNEQLAQMVQTKATSKEALSKIEGVGEARIEKYSERILILLNAGSIG